MNFKYSADYNNSLSWFEQAASFFGRLLIIFAMVYTTLVFHTATWHHFEVPKTNSFKFIVLLVLVCWAVLVCGHRMIRACHATPVAFFTFAMMFTSLAAVNLAEAWISLTFWVACMAFTIMVPSFSPD